MQIKMPLMTYEFTAPRPDMLSVRVVHHRGVVDRGPHYPLNLAKAEVSYAEDEKTLTFSTGHMSVTVTRYPFALTFKRRQDGDGL